MICYSCNTDYPHAAPEPFYICPACKGEPQPTPALLPLYWFLNPREQEGFLQQQRESTNLELWSA